MLVRDPAKRPDAATILRHEWLRSSSNSAGGPEAALQPEILNRMKNFANMNRFKKEALRVSGERESARVSTGPAACSSSTRLTTCLLCTRAPQVVATHLPPEEIEGIRSMFEDMDADGSGTISFEELREGEASGLCFKACLWGMHALVDCSWCAWCRAPLTTFLPPPQG
jgi:calcium-dependent protein kinase